MSTQSELDQEIDIVNFSDSEEDSEPESITYAISSYGADYDVDGLVRRLRNDDIFVPPFQREYVWTLPQASRFIESLLLGLPVPGIFLSRDPQTQQLLVVDGQQRLRTLQFFFDGVFSPTKREFSLRYVQRPFIGLTYNTLNAEDRRRLNDSIIHATIVKQDEPSEDNSSIYYLFERLNTGGLQLTPQEVRSCVHYGPFNDLLGNLNKDKAWRALYGPVSRRMRDRELILRFFALLFHSGAYKPPMKGFLNGFMSCHRFLNKGLPVELLSTRFETTVSTVAQSLGEGAFKPRGPFNAAVFDAIMVGLARRLESGPIVDLQGLKDSYQVLLENSEFLKAVETGTASEESVKIRLSEATKAFGDVK